MRRFAVLLAFAVLPVHASIEAPDHIYYGSVTLFGLPAPGGTVVEARTQPGNVVLRRYVIGSNSHLGERYALHIPMDQVEPRLADRARPGDPLRFFVDGQLAGEASVGAVGQVTRLDLDPQNAGTGPAISIADAQVYESDAGQLAVQLAVSLNTSADRAVTIHWETRNGSASGGPACAAGVDFVQRSGQTLAIPAGQLGGTITVQVCGDATVEPNEQFSVELLSTLNDFGVFAKSTAQVTILDDDNVPTLAVGNVRVAEPLAGSTTARFVARLSRSHENPVSFTWATQNASALAASDYSAAGGTVTIAPGDTDAYLDVAVLADGVVEPDETFRLVFSNGVSLGLPQTYAYGTIVDTRHDPALQETGAVVGGEGGIADLASPQAIVLSPDGLHAYAASGPKHAVLHFSRDPASGALAFLSAYKSSTAGFAQARLQAPQDIEVSADGRFLYVAASASDSVTVLSRDVDSGVLGFAQTLTHQATQGAVQVQGLDEVVRLALSPDGAHLYALGRASNAIATFARDAGSGLLTYQRVLASNAPGLGALSQPNGIAVAPNGAQVYVTARFGNAVFAFDRNADSAHAGFGQLALKAAHIDGLLGITGLKGAHGIALSSDGRHVYVAAEQDNAVVLFNRDAAGNLTQRRIWRHGEVNLHGLRGAQGIEVAPDGREVFVTGAGDDSLTIFKRRDSSAATEPGNLAVHRTVFKGDGGLEHLWVPGAMASSGDNRYLYVAASGERGAIVVYRRLSADTLFRDGFELQP